VRDAPAELSEDCGRGTGGEAGRGPERTAEGSHAGPAKAAHGEAAAERRLQRGMSCLGLTVEELKDLAKGGGRESGPGVVASGGDDGFFAVGERAAGDGALHAGDESDQPDEAGSWAEARATSA